MTSLTGEFVTDLPRPDLIVACTDAIDGLGWRVDTVEPNRIVSYVYGSSAEQPKVEVILDDSSQGTEVRIIGSDTDAQPVSDDALVAALNQARDVIQAAVEQAVPTPQDPAHSTSETAPPEHVPIAPDMRPPREAAPPSSPDLPQPDASAFKDEPDRIPIFGARGKAKQLADEVTALRDQLARTGALSLMEVEQRRETLEREIRDQTAAFERQRTEANAQLGELREKVVVTEETAVLQEVGIYEYRHPLFDAVAYQAELKRLRDRIKTMARKDGGAVLAAINWTVNNSLSEGRKMVRDFSKLLLRAYNAEADNLVRGLKPYKLESAIDRLTKVATTIVKLGRTMDIRISDGYHSLRIRELELTADYLEKVAEEKEREHEEKARLREERKTQQEMERERVRLEKERQHYENALMALEGKGDEEGAARLRDDLGRIERAIEDVDYRAANVRAGYVYVISNVGSLGEEMVKIGLTRRLEPIDRVRELGDASVPFKFDVHALFFSDDAVGVEAELHRRLADRRVNRVNLRREFFYATPADVKQHLLEVAGELLKFEEIPEAVEYHQSQNASRDPQPGAAPASEASA